MLKTGLNRQIFIVQSVVTGAVVDEPSQGLAPIIVADVYRTLAELRDRAVAILLVEQNALLALKVAQRAYVLDDGNILYDGAASDLAGDAVRMRTLWDLPTCNPRFKAPPWR